MNPKADFGKFRLNLDHIKIVSLSFARGIIRLTLPIVSESH
jgi:hypothetical protein